MSRYFEEKGNGQRIKLTIVSPEAVAATGIEGIPVAALQSALATRGIEFVPQFGIAQIERGNVISDDGRSLDYDLLMLVPAYKVQVLRSVPALLMKITISELTTTCAFQALAACTPPVIA